MQFRTISMDWWASLEHKICYKKDVADYENVRRDLRECADIGASLDERMESIRQRVERGRIES